jgi:GTPase-associated protein 1, N-terminal domain type 1/Effector-associated domain 1
MIIEQAIYGDRHGAHALLASSSESVDIKNFVKYTDLPDVITPGVRIAPYVSSHHIGEFLTISRTFPEDPQATRPGMVFSHVLFIPKAEAIHIGNLECLFGLLCTTPNRLMKLESIRNFENPTDAPKRTALKQRIDLPSLLQLLISQHRRKQPIVWVGYENFEAALSILWEILWPEARLTFRFRLSLSPHDITNDNIDVVYTEPELKHRWSGHAIFNHQNLPESDISLAVHLLTDHPKGEALQRFLSQLGYQPTSLTELAIAEERFATFNSINTASFSNLVGLTQSIARWAEDANAASDIKRAIVSELLERIKVASVDEICSLRNVRWTAYAELPEQIFAAVNQWIYQHFQSATNVVPIAKLASLALQELEIQQAWATAVLSSISEYLLPQKSNAGQVIWEIWKCSVNHFSHTSRLVPDPLQLEHLLAEASPDNLRQNSEIALAALAFARGHSLFTLHAAILAKTETPRIAFSRQLEFDTDATHLAAISYLSAQLPAEETFKAARISQDFRLIPTAGKLLLENPERISHLTAYEARDQEILKYTLTEDSNFANLIPNSFVYELLDARISGATIDSTIFYEIGRSQNGNIYFYKDRATAWKFLPLDCVDVFLSKSAKAWAEVFASNPSFDFTLEPELKEAACTIDVLRTVFERIRSPSLSMALIEQWSLGEELFIQWLTTHLDTFVYITRVDATEIGRFIHKMKWANASSKALAIYESSGDEHIRTIVSETWEHLGLWDKARFFFKGKGGQIKEEEFWEGLEETLTLLYPEGVESKNIWERAKGSLSEVKLKQSGKDQWHAAIQSLRHGGGGDQETKKLLREAKRDYPKNQKVSLLVELWEKFQSNDYK